MRNILVWCLSCLLLAGCAVKLSPSVELLPLPQEMAWSDGFFRCEEASLSGDPSAAGALLDWLEESGSVSR